jgi:hypothetical protein
MYSPRWSDGRIENFLEFFEPFPLLRKRIDGSCISILLFVGDDDDNDTVVFDWMTQMLMLLVFSLCWLT